MSSMNIGILKVYGAAGATLQRMRDDRRSMTDEIATRLTALFRMAAFAMEFGDAERIDLSLDDFLLIEAELRKLR